MATASNDAGADTLALASVPEQSLHDLFEQERAGWLSRLLWDVRDAAGVAVHAVSARVLDGVALRRGRRYEGYLAYQPSTRLARLCSGWLSSRVDEGDARALVDATLRRIPRTSRIEGQVVAFDAQPHLDAAFAAGGCLVEEREYLIAALPPGAEAPVHGVTLQPVDSRLVSECARVLVDAHHDAVEARINQSFRTERGAHEYLTDILAGQGCGDVLPDACVLAVRHGRVIGFCLGTTVSPGTGHVPQIAVCPKEQGSRAGSALLGASLAAMRAAGCTRVTLSVSCGNARAASWYRRRGFAPAARFAAYHREAP